MGMKEKTLSPFTMLNEYNKVFLSNDLITSSWAELAMPGYRLASPKEVIFRQLYDPDFRRELSKDYVWTSQMGGSILDEFNEIHNDGSHVRTNREAYANLAQDRRIRATAGTGRIAITYNVDEVNGGVVINARHGAMSIARGAYVKLHGPVVRRGPYGHNEHIKYLRRGPMGGGFI